MEEEGGGAIGFLFSSQTGCGISTGTGYSYYDYAFI